MQRIEICGDDGEYIGRRGEEERVDGAEAESADDGGEEVGYAAAGYDAKDHNELGVIC